MTTAHDGKNEWYRYALFILNNETGELVWCSLDDEFWAGAQEKGEIGMGIGDTYEHLKQFDGNAVDRSVEENDCTYIFVELDP